MNNFHFLRSVFLIFMLSIFAGFVFIENIDNIFYGVFDKHPLNWFIQNEVNQHSIQTSDTTDYFRPGFSIGSKKYIRIDSNFISPSVEYAYDKKNYEVKELHYEWNLEKSGKDKYQSDMAGFVEKFKQFQSIINLQIGKETAKNLIDNKSQDFVEIAQPGKQIS